MAAPTFAEVAAPTFVEVAAPTFAEVAVPTFAEVAAANATIARFVQGPKTVYPPGARFI